MGPSLISCSKIASIALSLNPSIPASPWWLQLHGIPDWTVLAGACPGKDSKTKLQTNFQTSRYTTGYRYRLHVKGLPGKPDLVFPARRAVIFVHGCFWHGHDCALFRWPSSREEFWRAKIAGNIGRDQTVTAQLIDQGWRVLDVWECKLKGRERVPIDEVLSRCADFLEGDEVRLSIGRNQTVSATLPP